MKNIIKDIYNLSSVKLSDTYREVNTDYRYWPYERVLMESIEPIGLRLEMAVAISFPKITPLEKTKPFPA